MFVDDVVLPLPPPESVLHRCFASSNRIVRVFFYEPDLNQARHCEEHSPDAMAQNNPYIESHPYFYD